MNSIKSNEGGQELRGDFSISYRLATAADAPRIIEVVNAAFSIEDFLGGSRTDEARLAAMMEKGSILLAEDVSGKLVGPSTMSCAVSGDTWECSL